MILWFRDLNFLKQWYKPVAVFHCTKNEVIEEIFDGKLHFLWGLLMNVRSEKNHENATKHLCWSPQKQRPRGVHMKSCFENMQQIYRRTPMPKCDFSKVALQLYWNRTSPWVFSCKFAAYFQNNFSQEHLWVAAFDPALRKVGILTAIKF